MTTTKKIPRASKPKTMPKARTAKRAVPPMHPREPLTQKARAAIEEYADHQAQTKFQGYRMAHIMVDWVLEAERMPRARLYTMLEEWGYRWQPQPGFWQTKKKRQNRKDN